MHGTLLEPTEVPALIFSSAPEGSFHALLSNRCYVFHIQIAHIINFKCVVSMPQSWLSDQERRGMEMNKRRFIIQPCFTPSVLFYLTRLCFARCCFLYRNEELTLHLGNCTAKYTFFMEYIVWERPVMYYQSMSKSGARIYFIAWTCSFH